MTNPERIKLIEDRITAALAPTQLKVIDESDQHIGHAGHQGGGRHFALEISAACLQNISRVAAHRKIYALFTDMMPEQIHALKIKIV
jgi:BolA protein